MCETSKLSDDWVVKGCHIHVNGVELAMFSDHLGGLGFKPVFASSAPDRVKAALRAVRTVCLPDLVVRTRWITRLSMARAFMLDYQGNLASQANGRMFEFKMIQIAIQRWKA